MTDQKEAEYIQQQKMQIPLTGYPVHYIDYKNKPHNITNHTLSCRIKVKVLI